LDGKQEEYLEQELTGSIINASIKVHRALGPGLLESAYQLCLQRELEMQGIAFQSQLSLPVVYHDLKLDVGYRIDLLVENRVIVELKAVEHLEKVHEAQLLTYLRMSGKRVGLLINFNTPRLRDGIIRRIM
jgi:GxxExxY protein